VPEPKRIDRIVARIEDTIALARLAGLSRTAYLLEMAQSEALLEHEEKERVERGEG
jgi:hypothetical protein